MKWFVMLNCPPGNPLPLVYIDDERPDSQDVALFDTEEEADNAAINNSLGSSRGWKTYLWEDF